MGVFYRSGGRKENKEGKEGYANPTMPVLWPESQGRNLLHPVW